MADAESFDVLGRSMIVAARTKAMNADRFDRAKLKCVGTPAIVLEGIAAHQKISGATMFDQVDPTVLVRALRILWCPNAERLWAGYTR